ncbi:MAG: hypothetical protein RMJ66_02770 [Bacteroidia bacterium]|nr:hypothetical protein [Bacteroidia bacterium]
MIVEVSQDGENWRTFPYDSLTGRGLAGRTPTGCMSCSAPINWQDPAQAGGDTFDLRVVGLPWIRFVRVRDATHWQSPDRLSAELDGIVAIHQLSNTHIEPLQNERIYAAGGALYVKSPLPPSVRGWDGIGRPISLVIIPEAPFHWKIESKGLAFLQVETPEFYWTGKVLFSNE